ncbi:MFS transporter [Meiothermus sp. QL-1]|nr:MFS transporter [Meiothermus sp. QL-1]
MTGAIGASPGAAIPRWQDEFSIQSEIAWYFNLLFLGALLGIYLGSRLRRRHPWLPLALLTEGLALGLIALAPGAWGLYGAAFFLGLGVAVVNFHCNALPVELFPNRPMVVLGRVNAAFGLGAVLAPLLLLWLPWRLGYGLLALVALVTAFLLRQAPPPQNEKASSAGPRPRLLPYILLAVVAYVAVELVLSSYSSLYLLRLGYPDWLVGLLLSLFWVAFTLGRFGLAAFVARQPLERLFWLHLLALGAVFCYFIPPLAWLFPLLGFLVAPTFPTLYGFARVFVGYRAAAYLFYAGAVGGNLVPAAFATLPQEALAWGLLGVVSTMALSTHLLRRNGEAKSPVL